MNLENYVSRAEIAISLGISEKGARNLALPKYIDKNDESVKKIGNKLYWKKTIFKKWLDDVESGKVRKYK